jgi:hypothetical protein
MIIATHADDLLATAKVLLQRTSEHTSYNTGASSWKTA